ncbi:hypothetical protein N9D31_01615 [Oligoflexaceae bacterium]|nr:hypothetical protein [Oligoflexaceae bacterium]
MKWGVHQLHHSWKRFLPEEALNFSPPKEKRADCLNCPKIKSDQFRPSVKCCTYHPKVPNYMLGYALKESKTSAKKITALVEKGRFTPEGGGHTPLQWMDVMRLDQSKSYGKSDEVVCSFVEDGGCSIYSHRNSACATYFCQYDDVWGEEFWERMHHYMGRVELALVQICLKEAGFDLERYHQEFSFLSKKRADEVCDPVTKMWNKDSLDRLWGNYRGREAEFFRRCADTVDALSDPKAAVVAEVLISPNLIEISAMESRVGGEEEPCPFEVVEARLLNFVDKVTSK